MPLNQLYSGQSIIYGASFLARDSILAVQEGYWTGTTYEYVDIGTAYIDDITHNRQGNRDIIQISASNRLKQLSKYRFDNTYTYESAYAYFDDFNVGNIYSDRWQATSNNWTQNGNSGQLTGTSTSTFEGIALTTKTKMLNTMIEIKFKVRNDAGYVVIASRSQAIAPLDSTTNVISFFDMVSDSRNSQTRPNTSGTLSQAVGLIANTNYWLRQVVYNNRIYTQSSGDGMNFSVLGSTWHIIAPDVNLVPGTMMIDTQGNITDIDYIHLFEYKPIYDINYLINDVTFKSGIDDCYIPDVYTKSFTDSTGWTWAGGGTYLVNASTGILTTLGASNAREWGRFHSGVSFKNFNFECEFMPGATSYGGVFVGRGSSDFASIFWQGLSNSSGSIELSMRGSGGYEKYIGASRYTKNILFPNFLPESNIWKTFNIIKNEDQLYFAIDGEVIYSVKGDSGINIDGYNCIGFMQYGNFAGISASTSFRNVKVKSLPDVIPSFQIQPNTSGRNALDRLQESGDFEYLMSGNTFTIIPTLGRSDLAVRSYNIGTSHPAWNIYTKKTDNKYNHIIVYGKNDLRADSWDVLNLNEVGEERVLILSDENLATQAVCQELADTKLYDRHVSAFSMSFENKAQVDLEQYDVVTIIDEMTGISQNLRIENTNKSFNLNTADFTQTFTLQNP